MAAIFAETSLVKVTVALVALSVYTHARRFTDAKNVSFRLIKLARVHLEQTKRFWELLKAISVDLRS